MELGSGSSTVLFAAALRANGGGRLISIEHDRTHAEHTRRCSSRRDLSDRVELMLAPLADLKLGGRVFQWYDLGALLMKLPEKIDLLFVDGPPGKVQSLSRYPALPIFAQHLSPRALVIVDDGAREDELEMVRLWRELDGVGFEAEALDFLPHAPVLLTMAASESRIAELRRAREGSPRGERETCRRPCRRRCGFQRCLRGGMRGIGHCSIDPSPVSLHPPSASEGGTLSHSGRGWSRGGAQTVSNCCSLR